MKKVWLLTGVAMLAGCVRHYGYPPAPVAAAVPQAQAAPQPPLTHEEAPSPVRPEPADAVADHPAEEAPPTLPSRSIESAARELNGALQDAYFAYDQFDLSAEAMAALARDAALLRPLLREFPALTLAIEGHCDERGSAEYNLGLGDRRATRAAEFLFQLGLPRERFVPVSMGKEAPQCAESTEACWRLNRRAHFVARAATDMTMVK